MFSSINDVSVNMLLIFLLYNLEENDAIGLDNKQMQNNYPSKLYQIIHNKGMRRK